MPNHDSQSRVKAAFDFIHIDLGGGRTILSNASTDMLVFDEDILSTIKRSQ